jgi:hypothetical protein
MRVREGARKINQQGGAIYIHEEKAGWSLSNPQVLKKTTNDVPQSPLASIEVRDYVYSTLIRLSPATDYFEWLIAGEKGLLARGFSGHQLDNYGGLPSSFSERDRLVKQLLKAGQSQPQLLDSLLGVPGFWEDVHGTHLWKPIDYRAPRLLIPVRDEQGRIQACQMRCPGKRRNKLRYCWLSSLGLPSGAGSGSPLHFTFSRSDLTDGEFTVIVEGALKADVLFALRPDLHIVATAGVSANHEALIELTKGRRALIAFDQDYYNNAVVCLRLASLITERWRSESTLATTRIAVWDRSAKGIDDAVPRKLPITSISVQRWFSQLSQDFKRKVASVLNHKQK